MADQQRPNELTYYANATAGTVTVCITPPHYNKAVHIAVALAEALPKALPPALQYEVVWPPTIVVFGGRSKKGVMGVELVILPICGVSTCVELLRSVGFFEEHEELCHGR